MAKTDVLHSGELYFPSDPEIMREQTLCMEKLYDYNATRPLEAEKRAAMLKDMFAEIGEGCWIEPPLRANWAGAHVHFGKNVYANFNLTLVDDTDIFVGDCTMIAPNVTIVTASHPIAPRLREQAYQYNRPVHIGRNVWIGAGVTILAGVTIGDNSVIGAGSLVNRDIPANVVAYGVPCRVARPIGERDEKYLYGSKELKI